MNDKTEVKAPQKVIASILNCSVQNVRQALSGQYKKAHVASKIAREWEQEVAKIEDNLRRKYSTQNEGNKKS